MIVRDLPRDAGPLCPNTYGPAVSPEHAARVRALDAFHDAAPKNPDGELVPDADVAYYAAAYGPASGDRMQLHTESVTFLQGTQPVRIESWWFRCPICGLILPAAKTGAW